VITAASTVVGRLEPEIQRLLVAELGQIRQAAPLFTPYAGALPMSVRITNAGPVGWCATMIGARDERGRLEHPLAARSGYHYSPAHPVTGRRWPPIPALFLELADRFRGPDEDGPLLPWDVAHIVFYRPGAVLGWHVDKTEANLRGRVITFVLGDPALWEIEDADGAVTSHVLVTGDVVRLSGPSRSLRHRIAKVMPGDTGDMFNPSPLAGPGRVVISVRSGAGR
jgi:alkylated DNA repair protein (DNA oxidative demethylase)